MGGGIGRIALGAVGFGLGSMVGFPALGASLMMGLGGMLGGPPKQEKKQRQVKGMLGSSSVEGTPLAVLFGRTRIGGTLLWKGEVSYHEIKKKQGKGGASGSAVSSAWYEISFAMVLGEGVMALVQMYEGKNKVSPSHTWYEGTETQAADSFLTQETGLSIPYIHTCYVVFQNYNVGPSPAIPQLTFEVASGQSKFDVSLTIKDTHGVTRNETKSEYITVTDLNNCVTPPYAMKTLMKNTRFGAGFNRNVDWLESHSDCIDRSYFLNTAITERLDLAGLLEMIAAHGWVITVFSGSDIRLLLAKNTVPTKSYHLDDMIGTEHESVIDVSESGRSERFNRLSIEYTDPAKEYSTRPVQVEDLGDQQAEGVKKNTVALPGFTDKDIAKEVGYKMLRNSLYGRRLMSFSLGPKELATEPGDLMYLNAIGVGLTLTRCRVMGVDEDEQFNLAVTAREEPFYIFDPINYTVPNSFAAGADHTLAGLSQVGGFIMHEVPKETLLTSPLELMPIYSKRHKDTIGANIYYSVDNISYDLLLEDRNPSPSGLIGSTFDQDKFLDTTELVIDSGYGTPWKGDTFDSLSRAATMSTKNLSLINNELVLFQNSSLGTTASYTLTDFVRGRYNTKVVPHAQGSRLFLLDGNDRTDMLLSQIGVHYYFKAVPVNTFQKEGDISEVTAVGLTIQGWAYRPYAPGSIWQEESGVNTRSRTKTSDTDITIAWKNCTKYIGFGTFPYNTREYGDYNGDIDITGHEIDVYGLNYISGIGEQNELNMFFNGTDGSVTDILIDLGTYGHTFTHTNGQAEIDTAQSKFGGASGLFNGNQWFGCSNHTAFDIFSPDSAPFTIDFWVRFNTTVSAGFCGQYFSASNYWGTYYDGTYLALLTSSTGRVFFRAPWTPNTNQWYHIAFVRIGSGAGERHLFIDGVDQALESDDNGAKTAVAQSFKVGYFQQGNFKLDGWLDDLRIVKGTAKWTTDFTPPTSSNFGEATVGFIKTVDVGLTQSYTYTEVENLADNQLLQTGLTFKTYTKSIYGRSRWSKDKTVHIIE